MFTETTENAIANETAKKSQRWVKILHRDTKTSAIQTDSKPKMKIRNTRTGFTQAQCNDDASSLVSFEILLIAVACEVGMQSWWWRGGIFLGGMIVMVTPVLYILFCLAMTAAWAVAGNHIGETIGQDGANYVIAIVAGLISLGAQPGDIKLGEEMGVKA